jgi:hypothetical protein
LSDSPLFVIVNAYAISSSSVTLANILNDKLGRFRGKIKHGELTLEEKSHRAIGRIGPEAGGRILSTGIYAIWSK